MTYPIVTEVQEVLISRLAVLGTVVTCALAGTLVSSDYGWWIGAMFGIVLSCSKVARFRDYQRMYRERP